MTQKLAVIFAAIIPAAPVYSRTEVMLALVQAYEAGRQDEIARQAQAAARLEAVPDTFERQSYDMREVAEKLGVSVAFLYKEIERGKLKGRKFGGRRLIMAEDLKAYIAEGREA